MAQSGFSIESLRGWMTLPYMANRYKVPAEALFAALGVEQEGNQDLSLRQLIEKYHLDAIQARRSLETAILAQTQSPGDGQNHHE
jgi:hypothetical protein